METPAGSPLAFTPAPDDKKKAEKMAANLAKKNLKMEKFLAKQNKSAEIAASDAATAAAAATATASSLSTPACTSGVTAKTDASKKKAKKAANAQAAFVPKDDATLPLSERIALRMQQPMADAYSPSSVESLWGQWWESRGFYEPVVDASTLDAVADRDKFFIVPIPPPNVTGSLHLGHALTVSIQDTMIRWNRMRGKTVLYNPGCDHAGIATQSVVEKRLWKEQKLTRHDLGREKFLEQVWQWKEKYGDRIYTQIRSLGTSCDWKRACFTMDPKLSVAVTEAFVRLHREGVIYRSTRLVNWCSHLNTALSNLEVDSKELTGRTLLSVPGCARKVEFGVLISFAYKIKSEENGDAKQEQEQEIVVATTRIETMLGDTAIAVHPNDKRYSHLVGKCVVHPFVADRRIVIVADEYVDMEFGTGAVKITPAHDANDFDVAKRHGVPAINILNDDGTLNANAGPQFAGLHRFDARYKVLDALKACGAYRDTKDNAMIVPVCSRSGDIIEPRLKPQWWVRCKEMADAAANAVRNKEIEILPKASEKEWFRWLDNIQDWCISRQLWWGHRVPAYRVEFADDAQTRSCEERKTDGTEETENWVSGRTLEEATQSATEQFPGRKFTLHQDEDVLDTWFSSGLWPFSIFGWPEKTQDLQMFYPASLLETGWDILFFWVARMVMMGIKLTGRVPFHRVFCHAMVRDAHGRKMSKSLGNVIDPDDVIRGISLEAMQARLLEGNLDPREVEKAKAGMKVDYPRGISECGTDALRFALCAYTSTNRDLNLDILRVEGYRKFCNKIWNALRFAFRHFDESFKPTAAWQKSNSWSLETSPAEHWILSRLSLAAEQVNESLTCMNFMTATSAVYNFWLYELCDIFIEASKVLKSGTGSQTLYVCLDMGLRLLHPFMPFVTEELWQRLPKPEDAKEALMLSEFPTVETFSKSFDKQIADAFARLLEVARSLRALVTDYSLPADTRCAAYVDGVTSDVERAAFERSEQVFCALVRNGVGSLHLGALTSGCAVAELSASVTGLTVGLDVIGVVDIEQEIEKAREKLDKAKSSHAVLIKAMGAPGYAEKVKADIQKSNELKKETLSSTINQLTRCLASFEKFRLQ